MQLQGKAVKCSSREPRWLSSCPQATEPSLGFTVCGKASSVGVPPWHVCRCVHSTPPSLRRRWNGSIALRSSSTAGDAARANGQLEGLLGEAQRLLSAKEEADEDVRREEEGRHGGKADCRCEMEHRAHDLKVELALSVISQLSHVAARSGLFEGPRFPHLLRGLTHQVDFTFWILSTHVTC